MTERVGQQFGQYRLTRFLGRGSFGEVYLGEQVRDTTLAAVKLLQGQLTQEGLKEFINEASATFRLQHPHIVRLLDFGIGPGDTPFLTMAYASNGTLRQRYSRGTRLPLATVVSYVTPIAAALQHAHDQRLVHRDVKPENILLGPNNEVWLSDFGISALAHSTRSLDTERSSGTLPYMAPEQLQGKPRPASDQYALGIMAYEWLCGERPFSGMAWEIVSQHLSTPPPPLRGRVPTIPPEVEQVVMTALAKDYKQRFGSVQAFARALEQASQLGSSQAMPRPAQINPAGPPAPPTAPIAANPPSQAAHLAEMGTPANPTAAPTGLVAPANPPVMPREMARSTIPSAAPAGMSIPASPTAGPTEAITPASQTSLPPVAYPIPQASVGAPPLTREPVAPGEPVPAQRGISRRIVVLGLAALTVVGVAGGGIAWLAHSQHSTASLTPIPSPTLSPTQSPTQSTHVIIHTATVLANGVSKTVLTNAQGFTLYYFTPDTSSTSACTGGCASVWPPLLFTGSGTPASSPALPGKITVQTAANGAQVEYNGHLLYTFSGDSAAGQANGEGVGSEWFVATPTLS